MFLHVHGQGTHGQLLFRCAEKLRHALHQLLVIKSHRHYSAFAPVETLQMIGTGNVPGNEQHRPFFLLQFGQQGVAVRPVHLGTDNRQHLFLGSPHHGKSVCGSFHHIALMPCTDQGLAHLVAKPTFRL